jgi:DNA mismatch endonuclease (patch repair protein)
MLGSGEPVTDVFSAAKRSEIMARVRGRGNKATEMALAAFLRRHRIAGWRRHVQVFGNPDFVFSKSRVAVFVDGCFWHSCPKHASHPMSNREFWAAKLARNKARDRLVTRRLRQCGWQVLRVWQHELSPNNEHRLLRRLRGSIETNRKSQPVRE